MHDWRRENVPYRGVEIGAHDRHNPAAQSGTGIQFRGERFQEALPIRTEVWPPAEIGVMVAGTVTAP